MPIQSRYSNEEFEGLMQDVFTVLEQRKASRDLSIMALGNVLATIFQQQVENSEQAFMVDQFCKALKNSAISKDTVS